VYRNFASLEDFEGEIALLRALPSNTETNATTATKVRTPENTNQKTGK
jgi:transcriptional repressor NrdR